MDLEKVNERSFASGRLDAAAAGWMF